MERLLLILPLLAYGFVAFVHLLPGVVNARAERASRSLGAVAAVAHASYLLLALVSGTPPGLAMALSTLSLVLMLGWLWIRTSRSQAMLVAPLALVVLGTSQVIPQGQVMALETVQASAWVPVHLGLMFSGLVGFVVSFVLGIFYLVQRSRLKRKDFSQLGRLPSLETLDRLQFRAMLFGFVFLTLGIGVGGAFAAASLQQAWALDPKVAFTLIIWLWYGIALQVRLVAGWRGRWSALFSVVGFAGLLLSLVLSNVVLQSWHAYG